MPLYRTRLFEMVPDDAPPPPYRARGWTAKLRPLILEANDITVGADHVLKRGHTGAVVRSVRLSKGRLKLTYAPEIVLEASSRASAQRGLNLVTAAKTLFDSDFTLGQPLAAIPDDRTNLEDLHPEEYESALNTHICTTGLAVAAQLAARVTFKRAWISSLIKYWLSLRTCSIPVIEHHPRYGDRHTVEKDPFSHAIMAQAIVAAFSAIEELELEVKASPQKPSKVSGAWNPVVLNDLQARLIKAGIDPSGTTSWLLRNTPTRIERRYRPPAGQRAAWSHFAVRDRIVSLPDAIHYAGLLRSRVSAHRTHALTRSLTAIDVVNVQHLARRLLLEATGYWRWRSP